MSDPSGEHGDGGRTDGTGQTGGVPGGPGDGTAQDRPTRPAIPAYGEYAPEGWEWKPDETEAVPVPGAASAAGSAPSAGAGRLPGVPHNLGVRGDARRAERPTAAPGSPSAQENPAAPQQGEQAQGSGPAPYRAADPQPGQLRAAAAYPAPRPRLADRIITIALLALGAFGTLNFASSLFAIDSQLRLTAAMLGIDSLSLPGWVGVLGVVSGLAVLLIFALTLIFSIRRMRAGKLAFWAPLAAGAIVLVLVIIVQSIALSGAPEIMQQLQSDPNGSLQKMLEFAQNAQ